jgi:hypothetical protein
METIIGPARTTADRRPPERLAEDAADHPAGDGADRTRNNEAGSRSSAGTDPIGARVRRGQRSERKYRCR